MTPTEQEIEFFKEAKRIQELWKEIKIGDWYVDERGKVEVVEYERMIGLAIGGAEVSIWLPRLDQLIAMLIEKGYTVCLTGPYMLPKNYQVILAREDDETEVEYGPTPSIALGKCLLEVLKEE